MMDELIFSVTTRDLEMYFEDSGYDLKKDKKMFDLFVHFFEKSLQNLNSERDVLLDEAIENIKEEEKDGKKE